MLTLLNSQQQETEIVRNAILNQGRQNGALKILEAGCGRRWTIDLGGAPYHLTGIDLDKHALEIRKNQTRDLDEMIHGDLVTAELPENHFDVIFNSYVLEHIKGAEKVMENFYKWLKPGGIMVIRFPDRYSSFGFVARSTPFWFHVFIRKYIQGHKDAGKPGHDPYPTFHEELVSRPGIKAFCDKHNIAVKEEWGHPYPSEYDKRKWLLSSMSKLFNVVSFGKLAHEHNNLTYILQKK